MNRAHHTTFYLGLETTWNATRVLTLMESEKPPVTSRRKIRGRLLILCKNLRNTCSLLFHRSHVFTLVSILVTFVFTAVLYTSSDYVSASRSFQYWDVGHFADLVVYLCWTISKHILLSIIPRITITKRYPDHHPRIVPQISISRSGDQPI